VVAGATGELDAIAALTEVIIIGDTDVNIFTFTEVVSVGFKFKVVATTAATEVVVATEVVTATGEVSDIVAGATGEVFDNSVSTKDVVAVARVFGDVDATAASI